MKWLEDEEVALIVADLSVGEEGLTTLFKLLKAHHPGATASQLRFVLRSNADASIGGPGYDAASGFGRMQMVIPADLPTVTNLPPVADISGDAGGVISFTDSGKSGQETVTLDGADSSDPDGSVASYAWTWSGTDGSAGSGSGVSLRVTLAVGPEYTFSLVVTDDDGASSDPDAVTVTVAPKGGDSGGGGKGGGGGDGGGPGKGGGKPPK